MPERSEGIPLFFLGEGIPFFFLALDMGVARFHIKLSKLYLVLTDHPQTSMSWLLGGPAGADIRIFGTSTRGRSLFSDPSCVYEVNVYNMTNDKVPKLKSYYATYTLFHNKISI